MFFEDFFGGHPGMQGGMGGGPREAVDTDALYQTLGVEKNATTREVKKKWRSLCKKHHPDRGGDPEKFKEFEEAYHVLADSDKRSLYDEGGMEAVRSGHVSSNIFDLFGGGRRQQQQGPKKPAPIKQLLEIVLEDIYSGATTKHVKVTIMSADERNTCNACKGRGSVMETLRRGHMILQQQRKCGKCDGKGISFVNERKTEKRVEVLIPPGAKDGDHHVLDGEGHDLPGLPTGDVVIIFKIKPHSLYKRKGADLAMMKELTLREALCGYSFNVKSIERGNWILVKSNGGSVQHGDVIKIEEHGLPQKGKRGSVKGDLYIRFHVVLPDSGSLNASALDDLSSILSPDAVTYNMPGGGVIDTRVITVGSAVRLIGLQNRPDLNEVEGEVIQANIRPGQYAVQLVTGQTVAVRAELLELTEKVSTTDVIEETPGEGEYVEEVNGHKVEDMERVRHTLAQMGNIHDDDDVEDEEVSCRQM